MDVHRPQIRLKEVVQSLVAMLDEATQIVDFFDKWDEQKRVRRDIKRVVIENFDESSGQTSHGAVHGTRKGEVQVIDGFEFPVEVIRTDRKRSASIYLDGERIKVRVPKSLSDSRVRDLIEKKSPWIKRKLKEAELAAPPKPKEFVSGETFSYLGRNYRLKVLSGDTSSLKLRGGYLEANISGSSETQEEESQVSSCGLVS